MDQKTNSMINTFFAEECKFGVKDKEISKWALTIKTLGSVQVLYMHIRGRLGGLKEMLILLMWLGEGGSKTKRLI